MQTITPFLWFDDQAQEAVAMYTRAFDGSRSGGATRYDAASAEASDRPAGSVMTLPFELEGLQLVALNGGPAFKPTPAISFFVDCPSAADVDALWEALSDGGSTLMPLDAYPFNDRFGWLADRWGFSWQLTLAQDRSERRIRPFLMYIDGPEGRAEAAMELYTSVFDDSRVVDIARHEAGQPMAHEGTVSFGAFELAGQPFIALDSAEGHAFTFNEALSLQVTCEDQDEVDRLWNALSADPEAERCGWLKDRFGVSWQIVPEVLPKLLGGPDRDASQRATEAMLQMKKLDIAELQAAYDGRR